MKQGTGHSSNSGRKTDPAPKAVNPGGAGNLGLAQGNHASDGGTFPPRITPLYGDRGYEAPPIANTSRKSGSQGSY